MSQQETQNETPAPAPSKKSDLVLYLTVGIGALVVAVAAALALGDLGSPHDNAPSEQPSAQVKVDTKGSSAASNDDKSLLDQIDDLDFLNTDELEAAAKGAASELAQRLGGATADSPATNQETLSAEDSLEALNWLGQEKQRLAQWEQELTARKRKLDAQEHAVDQKLKKVDQAEANRLTSLAKLYDGMKHDQVARMIVKLDDNTIVSILPRMKTANASKILGLLPPDRGARISQKMITLSNK
ncbi:MAG TPA: hypothetical protein VLB27_02375 [candidate division Zixibacteria bacterium]|nr:hypothetical protein [candidate division Zixibacteria bacterium]